MIVNSKSFQRSKVFVCAALSALCVLHPRVARSDDDTPKVQAERFFLRGKDLMTAGHYEEASVAFDESLRIDRAGGTLLNLAECYVALGRFASARVQLIEAQKLAESAHRDDKAQFAAHRLAEIEPRVDHVLIRLPPSAPAIYTVTLDGHAIDPGDAKKASAAVDPGAHKILTTARGYQPFETVFEIQGEHSDLTLFVPVLAPIAVTPDLVSAPVVQIQRSPQWTIGWSVGSVGVAGLLVGAGLGGGAIAKWHDVKSRCPSTTCSDPTAVSENAQAKMMADGSTIAFGIGAAAAALGIVLVATSPSQAAHTQVRVGAQSLSFEGTF
jgi:hypothetical protein